MDSADLLIIGGTLVTMDANSRVREMTARLAISEGSIVAIGAKDPISNPIIMPMKPHRRHRPTPGSARPDQWLSTRTPP